MKRKLTALLLVLALLCTFVTPVMAGDNWWEEYVTNPMDDITITGVREDGTVETEGGLHPLHLRRTPLCLSGKGSAGGSQRCHHRWR